ncbi:ArsR family transcriptional regulator [Natrialbaceae archaeon A-chndr2]
MSEARASIRDLPPSAKLVYSVLEHHDQMTQQELAAETMLPDRTVRHALDRLESVDSIDREISFRDARQSLYSLTRSNPRAHLESSGSLE